MRTAAALTALALFVVAGATGAFAATIDEGFTGGSLGASISLDGVLTDWGVSIDFTEYDRANSAWIPSQGGVYYWIEDDATGLIGPGYGGQNFDAEAAYMAKGTNDIYAAFVTGFDASGQGGWGGSPSYLTGDLFFDLSPGPGDPTWDFAIALSAQSGIQIGHAYIPNDPDSDWYAKPDPYESSKPWQLIAGAGFTELTGISYAYLEGSTADLYEAGDYTNADHNVVEVALDIASINGAFGSVIGIDMHWTPECGNDVFDLESDIVIPEPGTAILALGAFVAGAYARRRKRKANAQR
jgi:hypothetical protein